jgi:hypothetical protein
MEYHGIIWASMGSTVNPNKKSPRRLDFFGRNSAHVNDRFILVNGRLRGRGEMWQYFVLLMFQARRFKYSRPDGLQEE